MSVANPFSGIISTDMKNKYKQAIDALLEDAACTVPVTFYFIGTKYEACDACDNGVIGNVGQNAYYPGGQGRFHNIQKCGICSGTGKRLVEDTADDYMAVIWDYRKWFRDSSNIMVAEGRVQTVSSIDLLPNIKRCQHIIFDTDIEEYRRHRFVLDGEPTPCGFGEDAYIISLWMPA